MKGRAKRWAIGAMLGATAGYLTGILTAPKSGKDTRKDIANATVKAKKEAEKKLKIVHSELDKLLVETKTKVKNVNSSAKDEFANVVAGAQIAKEKAKQVLSAVHEGDADDKDLQKAVNDAKKAASHLKQFLTKYDTKAKSK